MVTKVITAEPRVTRPLPIVVVARAPGSGTLVLPPAAHPPIIGIISSQRYLIAKRAVDIVLSALFLVAALVVLVPLAALIKLDSKGPILYRQRRVGQDGAPFDMLKFRSMYTNSDDKLHRQAIERYMRGEALNADGPAHAQFKL
ncbi:MAG TPA: sugar transferase, partial [Ktedonobacterales bacterium]